MKKTVVFVFAALALLAGCNNQANKAASVPDTRWKGAPYRLEFDTASTKVNPEGVTIPGIKYTANPEAVERRAILVVHFDITGTSKSTPNTNQMVMGPVDISGTDGALPADYMQNANKDLSKFLGAYCVKGKVKISVALARSSLAQQATASELDAKRLSDWLPIEVEFKKPRPGC